MPGVDPAEVEGYLKFDLGLFFWRQSLEVIAPGATIIF